MLQICMVFPTVWRDGITLPDNLGTTVMLHMCMCAVGVVGIGRVVFTVRR